MRVIFTELWELRFQTAEASFEICQGHWYWCYLIFYCNYAMPHGGGVLLDVAYVLTQSEDPSFSRFRDMKEASKRKNSGDLGWLWSTNLLVMSLCQIT